MNKDRATLSRRIKEDIDFIKWRARRAEGDGDPLMIQYWEGALWYARKIREEVRNG